MLKYLGEKWASNTLTLTGYFTTFSSETFSCGPSVPMTLSASRSPSFGIQNIRARQFLKPPCPARRRVIYEQDNDDEEEYEYNQEIAKLEMYTQSMEDEILLVRVMVDDKQVEVIIFKGFSSCLSYKTSSDPSRSVVPAKAVIKSIDRVKGPFDPSDIQYIEKGLTFDAFRKQGTFEG